MKIVSTLYPSLNPLSTKAESNEVSAIPNEKGIVTKSPLWILANLIPIIQRGHSD